MSTMEENRQTQEDAPTADYSAIFDAANDAIFIYDIESGHIVDVNRKATEMYCAPKEEMVHSTMDRFSSGERPYSLIELAQYMRKASDGEPQLYEWLAKDRAGRLFWVEVNLRRAVLGGKYRLLAIVRDISERKRTEERLQRINEAFLNFGTSISENINRLTALCGELLNADTALYNRLEDDALKSCGLWKVPEGFKTIDKAEGHVCYDVIKHPGEDMVCIRNLQETDYARTDPNVAHYGLQTYIGHVVRFGGSRVGTLCVVYGYDYAPTDEDRKIMGVIASAIGVEEERRSAEDILKFARFSIDRAGDTIFWIGDDAHILYANDMACATLQYSHDELANKSFLDIDSHQSKEAWPALWDDLKKKGVLSYETVNRRKDGTTFPAEVTLNYIEFEGDEFGFAFIRDIGERRNAENALLRRDYQLEVLSRTSQHVNAVLEVPVIIRTLIAAAMEVVGATGGMGGIVKDGRMLFTELNREGALEHIDLVFEPGHGVPGWVANSMKPYLTNDAAHDPQMVPEIRDRFGIYNLISVPIISNKGQLIGCFEIYNKEDHALFDIQDAFMLQGLAASAAVALENARMISERKRADDIVRQNEHFLLSVFSSIQDGISVLDTDMTIVRVNAVMEKWYAHAMPLVGKKCYEAYHGRRGRCEQCPTFESLQSGKVAVEVVAKTGAGGRQVGWQELYSYPLFDAATGQLKGVIEYVRDITDRKNAEERLRDSEERYRKIVENSNDVIMLTGSDGKIEYLSPACVRVLGYQPEELVGTEAWIVHEEDQPKAKEFFAKSLRGISGSNFEYRVVTKKGEIRWVSHSWSSIMKDDKAQVVISVIRDVTEPKRSDEQMKLLYREIVKSNKQMEQLALRDSQTGLYNHRYLNEVIESEFYRARRYAHPISVIMLDIDYFKSINDVYGHDFGDFVLQQFAKQLKRMVRRYDIVVRYGGEEFIVLSPGTDRVKAVALAQRLLDILKTYNFGDKKHAVKLKLSMGVASYPEEPMKKGMDLISTADRVLNKVKREGGNRVYSLPDMSERKGRSEEEPSSNDVKFLKKRIEKLTKSGRQNIIESIFAFARTIELRDHYTGTHVESTVNYATGIAKGLDMSPEELENIRQAAVLHDLGKVGISDKILHKKAKLTDKEFKEIQKHPQIAADIIRPIQFMHDIVPLVLYHHERWDGRGYPTGLKGEEIPIGARIIAIADVYQALISNRPYRKALSNKKALQIIREGAGTQFDPRIVATFLRFIKKEKD